MYCYYVELFHVKVLSDKNTHNIKNDDGEQLLDDLPISKANLHIFKQKIGSYLHFYLYVYVFR